MLPYRGSWPPGLPLDPPPCLPVLKEIDKKRKCPVHTLKILCAQDMQKRSSVHSIQMEKSVSALGSHVHNWLLLFIYFT